MKLKTLEFEKVFSFIACAALAISVIGCSGSKDEEVAAVEEPAVVEPEAQEEVQSEVEDSIPAEITPEPECVFHVVKDRFIRKAIDANSLGEDYLQRTAPYMPAITIEKLNEILGRPCISSTLKCENCGKIKVEWVYEIIEPNTCPDGGRQLVRRLNYSLDANGMCTSFSQSVRVK